MDKNFIVTPCIMLKVAVQCTQHLFHDEHYDKPLFWTYFKTTLFSLYLSGFLFWRPWQRLCLEGCKRRESGGGGRGGVRVGVGRTVGVGVGRVWLRMWGKGNGDSVAAKNNNNQEVCVKLYCMHVTLLCAFTMK